MHPEGDNGVPVVNPNEPTTVSPLGEVEVLHTPAKYALFAAVAVGFTVADQVSKIWVRDNLRVHKDEVQIIDGFLSFIHAENPGGSPTGYRTHMPSPLDGRKLGKDVRTLRFASPAASLFGYLNWHFDETYILLFRAKGWPLHLAKSLARYWFDWPFRFTSRKDRRLTLGNALAGGLRMALNKAGVPLWLESPLVELIEENGQVTGAMVRHQKRNLRIRARKGVVLAAGGFDKNQSMRDANAPLYPNALYSGGTSGNTGDAIRAGQTLGAETMNLQSTWAAPVFYVPGEDRGRLCTIERALPGSLMVNQKGERYLNEAASYHITGQQMARREKSKWRVP